VHTKRLKENPFIGIEKLSTTTEARYVTDQELAPAVEMGRRMGGLATAHRRDVKTAFHCTRWSVEVRAMTRQQVVEAGIEWLACKRQKVQARQVGWIECSPKLTATIDEAFAIKRFKVAGTRYIFGNMSGGKATLARLMDECVAEAGRRKIAFAKFSLQDCRPKGVTDKLRRATPTRWTPRCTTPRGWCGRCAAGAACGLRSPPADRHLRSYSKARSNSKNWF
jgi:hypothetical protein